MRQGDLPWDPPVYQGGIPHVEVNDTHFYREGYGRMAASCSRALRESVLRKLKSLRRPTKGSSHFFIFDRRRSRFRKVRVHWLLFNRFGSADFEVPYGLQKCPASPSGDWVEAFIFPPAWKRGRRRKRLPQRCEQEQEAGADGGSQ